MTIVTEQPQPLESTRVETREPLRMVFALVGREIRDTLRDWRIVVPIAILTILVVCIFSLSRSDLK